MVVSATVSAGARPAAREQDPSRADIHTVLRRNPIFAALSETELDFLLDNAEPVTLPLGHTIMRKGQPGSGFHILLQGRVRVLDDGDRLNPVTLARLRRGAAFGERSLLFDQPVSATIRCSSKVRLLSLSVERFKAVVEKLPSVRERMTEEALRQVEFNFLRTCELLTEASNAQINALLAMAVPRNLAAGEAAVSPGDAADQVMLVRSGQLRLVKPAERAVLLGFARGGAAIGAPAIRGAETMGMAAIAEEASQVLVFPLAAFRALLVENATLWARVENWARNMAAQERTIAAAAEAGEEAGDATEFDRLFRQGSVRDGRGLFARSYPVVLAALPELRGVACLAAACRWFGQEPELRSMVELPLRPGRGDSLFTLARKAEAQGLLTRQMRLSADALRKAPVPAIVASRDGRMRLLWRVTGKTVLLSDPDAGLVSLDHKTFLEGWDGQLLSLFKVPEFGASAGAGLIQRFAPLARPHQRTFINVILLTLLLQLLEAMVPIFSETIVDQVVLFDDWPLFYLMLGCTLVAAVMGLIGGVVRQLLLMYASAAIGANLQVRFLAHILAAPVDLVSRWRVGELTLRFHENEKILQIISRSGVEIFVDGMAVAIFGTLLVVTSAKLSVLALLFAGGMFGLLRWATPRLRGLDREIFHREEAVQSHLIELVDGVTTIKSLGREEAIGARGSLLLAEATDAEFRNARLQAQVTVAIEALRQAASLGVMWVGAQLVMAGGLTAGALIAFSGLLGALLAPIESISLIYNEILKLRISMDRVNEVLALPTEPNLPAMPCPPIQGEVRFEAVGFSYTPGAGAWTVAPTTLTIPAGMKVALVGPSGSGKSTFAKLINRLLEPTEGRIFIDGIDISQVDVGSLRRQIGVVEQSPYIFAGSIRDNICKADPTLPLERVVRAAKLSGCTEFIDRFPMGYDTKVGEGGRVLSGGQSQRIIIARALATDPALLIFDEATAALDTDTERLIQANLDAVLSGRTTFIIAHRLSTIRNADLILVMDRGRIVEQGSHDELFAAKGLYHRLCTASDEMT